MTRFLNLVLRVYSLLLRLYPKAFRNEFAEQMFLDFSDLALDADKRGSLVRFCLRELLNFPVNLLQIYWQESRIAGVLRSQPVNYGLRGALSFGLAFGLAIMIGEFVALILWVGEDSIVGWLQVYFYDLFHTEHGLELISWIPSALSSLVTGLSLGTILAFLFADRSSYARYILVTMLCWFLNEAVESILMHSANLWFFLGHRHTAYLGRTLSVLSGAFLGLIFYLVKSEKQRSVRMLIMIAVAYPLAAYLYIQLLFQLSVIETPWMFIALLSLMAIYIVGVFFMAAKSQSTPKIPWLVIVGAVGYPLLPYAGYYFAYFLSRLMDSPVVPSVIPVGSSDYWRLMFRIALEQSIYGTLFGLLIGAAWGLQKKNSSTQVMT